MAENIIIVDDEPGILKTLSNVLTDEGYDVTTAKDGKTAIKLIQEESPSLVLLDIWMEGVDGLETLRRIKEPFPNPVVIMMSGHGSIETAVKATKLGAYDYIEKPLSLEKVVLLVRHAIQEQTLKAENISLKKSIERKFSLIGESAPMKRLKELVKTSSASNARILISGENGTGKELVARAVHFNSPRRDQPFVEINCAAIPDSLIESELFGYEKGAFTGADNLKKGRFEQAHQATLFLDEIADMSLATQAKVLRVLQEQRFHRVGGGKSIEVDARIIAASNKDLSEEIKKGTFREDLYYRLNVIPLKIPPLRDRLDDIPLLIKHFLKLLSDEQGLRPKEIMPGAQKLLMRYDWPGNVRELKNLIERLMILVPKPQITEDDVALFLNDQRSAPGPLELKNFDHASLRDARTVFEREFILKKLEQHDWNISKTAEKLAIERTYLHRKMKHLGIEGPPEEG